MSKPDGYVAQVAGQRTSNGSAWGLWFELVVHDTDGTPMGFWHFGRLLSDGTFAGVVSDDLAALDTPVQMTGVFDALSTADGPPPRAPRPSTSAPCGTARPKHCR